MQQTPRKALSEAVLERNKVGNHDATERATPCKCYLSETGHLLHELSTESGYILTTITGPCKDIFDLEVFRASLTPEDLADIEAGRVSVEYLRCAAESMSRRK